jgi:hypothetical protein
MLAPGAPQTSRQAAPHMVGRDLDAAEGGADQRSTMDPAARQRTVMGLRHSPWWGTTSAEVLRHPPGVQATLASAPSAPGARLGRRSHRRLGRCQGRVQVGSYLGHDLLGTANPRLPAALAAAAAVAALGWGRGPDGDLVPGDLLVDGDGHGAPPDRSVRAEPTHLGSRPPNRPLLSTHALCRGRLGHAKAYGGADRSARRCAPRPWWSQSR